LLLYGSSLESGHLDFSNRRRPECTYLFRLYGTSLWEQRRATAKTH